LNIFNYNFAGLNGTPIALERFRNHPLLLVNTASECQFTPQYAKLQQLHNDYQQSGLVIIGMPSNDFGGQEPGNEDEIAEFIHENYKVSFPMTAKYRSSASTATHCSRTWLRNLAATFCHGPISTSTCSTGKAGWSSTGRVRCHPMIRLWFTRSRATCNPGPCRRRIYLPQVGHFGSRTRRVILNSLLSAS
jgi:glutathione peroxidase-family protein